MSYSPLQLNHELLAKVESVTIATEETGDGLQTEGEDDEISGVGAKHTDWTRKCRVGLSTGAYMLPHPAKAEKGGEDAYFVLPHALGVSDGVGGWAELGVDAGVFSRALMSTCARVAQYGSSVATAAAAKAAKDTPPGEEEEDGDRTNKASRGSAIEKLRLEARSEVVPEPQEILNEGHAEMKKRKIPGSATICVLSAHPSDAINGLDFSVANLGDSGFIVIGQQSPKRVNRILHRSRPQQSAFNTPYQLGIDEGCNTPADADLYKGSLKTGDVIVMGTDGLFDNLHDHEILSVLAQPTEVAATAPEALAKTIADLARARATGVADTPWYVELKKRRPEATPCGKLDDITVLVSLVTG